MLKKSLIFVLAVCLITICKAEHFSPKATHSFLSKTTTNSLQTDVDESSSSISSIIICPIIGTMLFIFSFILLWKNERAYVITCHRLDMELEECICLDSNFFSTDHDGHLVFVEGSTSCDEILYDKDFPSITAANVVKMVKMVEMYQWKENHHRENNHDHYDYSLVWSESFIDSSNFHNNSGHQNSMMNFIRKSEEIYGKDVHLGEYFLSDDLKKLTKNKAPMTLTTEMTERADTKIVSEVKNLSKEMYAQGDYIYIVKDKFQQTCGDLRIKFFEVKCGPTAVVAQQSGKSFVKHLIEGTEEERVHENDELCDSSQGCCYNCWTFLCKVANKLAHPITEILWIFEKVMGSKEAVFKEVTKEHEVRRNWLRLLGWVCSWLGICIFFAPLYTLLDAIPLFGSLLSTLAGWICLIFGLIVGTVLSVITICLAWLFYRPLISISLIVLSVGLGVGLSYA